MLVDNELGDFPMMKFRSYGLCSECNRPNVLVDTPPIVREEQEAVSIRIVFDPECFILADRAAAFCQGGLTHKW
jgi:hypothetical protein